MLMRNRANNAQARVPQIKRQRSIFPMQKSRKQTCKASYLIPIFYEEVIPGDTWEINMKELIRIMPQIAPPIDNLIISTFFFFDPHRLQWKNFTKQHGEKENPDDTIDYLTPEMKIEGNGFGFKTLQDYLWKPVDVNIKNTSLGERMYNRIYNNYFRSEFLQESAYINDSDEDDIPSNYPLRKITKMHDYFTDALPTLQQGEPITLPLGSYAPIYGDQQETLKFRSFQNNGQNGLDPIEPGNKDYFSILHSNQNTGNDKQAIFYSNNTNYTIDQKAVNLISKNVAKQHNINSGIYTDLSEAIAADIAALRLMIRTQEILEGDNRNGIRYTEMLEARYGTINPDLRLTRPQYLGGTRTPLFTTPVIQTSGTGVSGQNTPQGNLAGYGITTDGGQVIKASFGEWGAIMGLMAITAVPQYQKGLHRKFTRFERFDYMYPEFQGISDQAIKNTELFAQDDTVTDQNGETVNEQVWGYIPRYDEYRYFTNEICGELRSNYPQSLDIWHYAENQEELQNLNNNFIEDKTDQIIKRTLAVQSDDLQNDEDQFLCQFEFYGAVSRVLKSKAIPQTGGRIL